MRCFYHPSSPALALCKNCSKGLCAECVADDGCGAACRNRCEGEVRAVWEIIQRNKGAFEKTSSVYLRLAFFCAALGLLFLLFPFFFRDTLSREAFIFFLGGGGVFLMGALFNVLNARRFKKGFEPVWRGR